jgi:hypothetical protein
MDANARVDYFRSEIKGDIARLEKQMADQHTENLRILRDFEKRLEKLTHELKNVEMSAR